MAKRGARKTRRGGYLSLNPFNWGKPDPSSAPPPGIPDVPEQKSWWQFWKKDSAPVPASTPAAASGSSGFSFGSSTPSTSAGPVGGKKRKTRRGGRRHSKAAKIYGHH